MPIFMDRHELAGVSAADIAAAVTFLPVIFPFSI
ncbi:hypothetical protein At12D1_28950 [Agrobacterium tumefaciens]|nr:hypothetical protein At12D1_28950 [Agrobacterium tumefaciens]